MSNNNPKNNTVVIDWQNSTMTFYGKGSSDPVKVTFEEKKFGQANVFRIFCALALQQECYNKISDMPIEDWLSIYLWSIICTEIKCQLDIDSLNTYWSYTKNANPSYIKVYINDSRIDDEKQAKLKTQKLFVKHGCNHFFGEYVPLADGGCKLWDIEFENTTGQGFEELKEAIVSAVEKLQTTGYLTETKAKDFVLAVPPGLGAELRLSKFIEKATDSIFIVGQNLYSVVRDIIEAAEINRTIEGKFRGKFELWLQGSTPENQRKIIILICDPRSEEAVLHYAMVFGEAAISHLCKTIPIFQKWQNQMGSMGFEAYVTSAIPMSLTVIDGDLDTDPNKGEMVIVPMAFEEKSGLRPVFVIKKSQNLAMFQCYYKTFFDRLMLGVTRPINKITTEELTACKKLIGKYRVNTALRID